MPKSDKLTEKQELFISEYLKDFNGTQAAIRAGYSEDTAGSIACENLKKPDIASSIQEHLKYIEADNNKIIKENIDLWRKIIIDPESSNFERLKASEYLGRYAAMFIDKKEIEVSGNEDKPLRMVSIKEIMQE